MLTLERLRSFAIETSEVNVNGKKQPVPKYLAKYVEDHWTDFIRINKSRRKLWVPILLSGYHAFNELVNFDLSKKNYDDRVKAVEALHEAINREQNGILNKISASAGDKRKVEQADNKSTKTQNKSGLKLSDALKTISLKSLAGLLKNEISQFKYLDALKAKLDKDIKYLKSEEGRKRFSNPDETSGEVSRKDDAYQDPYVHDYTIDPAFRHPFTWQFQSLSNANLLFAVRNIYSAQSEGEGMGLESILETMEDCLAKQGHVFATNSTKDFTMLFGEIVHAKRIQIRQAKQALAQTIYDRLTTQLMDENEFTKDEFKELSNFVQKHGQFTTYVLPRTDIQNALDFAKQQKEKLKKPWFIAIRKEAARKYNAQKTFLETTIHSLEAKMCDTRALINAAEKSGSLHRLLDDYNKNEVSLGAAGINTNITVDNLLDREASATGEMKNLKSFRLFLNRKETKTATAIANTKWYQKFPGTKARKHYKQLQADLADCQKIRAVIEKSLNEGDTTETTETVKLVVDDENSKNFINKYNIEREKAGKQKLYTGSVSQLIESRQWFEEQTKLSSDRKTLIRNGCFAKLMSDYNDFRKENGQPEISCEGEEISKEHALEIIRNNADFSEFLKNQEEINNKYYEENAEASDLKERKEQDKQKLDYNTSVQVYFNRVYDRFAELIRLYNEFRVAKGQTKIAISDFCSVEVNSELSKKDNVARKKAFEQLQSNSDFPSFIIWYQDKLNKKEFKDMSDATRHFKHYLECVQRDLKNPNRFLHTRLKERITDAYDRFTDLVIYHGVNEFTQKQALRYITIIESGVEAWVKAGQKGELALNINNIDLNDDAVRKQFLEGLALTKKIIVGETIKANLEDGYRLKKEAKESLKNILPKTKFNDVGYSSVENLLLTRYSRINLAKKFSTSNLTQRQIDDDKAIVDASVTELVEIITAETNLNVKRQYQLIALDAQKYFEKLLFSKDGTARLEESYLITVKHEQLTDSIESYAKYFITKDLDETRVKKMQSNLAIVSKSGSEEKDVTEICQLEEVYYQWNADVMYQLLARIQTDVDLKNGLRTEIVEPYLKALESKETLDLVVFECYAEVYTILFTESEIQRAAEVMFTKVLGAAAKGEAVSEGVIKAVVEFIKANYDIISDKFSKILNTYLDNVSSAEQSDLGLLNVAEQLVVRSKSFDSQLDKIRFLKLQGILSGKLNLKTGDYIFRIKKSERAYPLTEDGKKALYDELISWIMVMPAPVLTSGHFIYNKKAIEIIKNVVINFKDNCESLNEISDRIRLAELMNAYNNRNVDQIKSVIDTIINETKGALGFPNSEYGRNALKQFFEETVVPDGLNVALKDRYKFDPRVETIALHFDTSKLFLDRIRIAKFVTFMSGKNTALAEVQSYVSQIETFPANEASKEELNELFLAFIYPNGVEYADVSKRYGYSQIIEYLVNEYGSEKVKSQCKIAKIADIFNKSETLSKEAVEAYIEKAKEQELDVFAKKTESEDKELVEVIKYYMKSSSDWCPNIQRLIEIFEPETNADQLLKSYRLKRLEEVFTNTGIELSKDEYENYQNLLGRNWKANVSNFERYFGEDSFEKRTDIFIEYINSMLIAYDNNAFDEKVIEQPLIFELAKLLIGEAGFGDKTVPDEKRFKEIVLADSPVMGKTYVVIWKKLLEEYDIAKAQKKAIDDVRLKLETGNYSKAVNTFQANVDNVNRYTTKKGILQPAGKQYKLKVNGIRTAAFELFKEQMGYERQLIKLNATINSIAKAILAATSISEVRKKVEELIKLSTTVPAVASEQLRKALYLLKQRQDTLHENLIRIHGCSDASSSSELLELVRLLPANDETRATYISWIQKFYKLQASRDIDLSEIKDSATNLMKLFHFLQNNSFKKTMKARLEETVTNGFDLAAFTSKKELETNIVDEAVNLLNPDKKNHSELTSENIKLSFIKILNLVKNHSEQFNDKFVDMIASLDDKTVKNIYQISFEGESLRRNKITPMIISLMKTLNDRFMNEKLSVIFNESLKLKAEAGKEVNVKLLDKTLIADTVSQMIEGMKTLLSLSESDTEELKTAALDCIKIGEIGKNTDYNKFLLIMSSIHKQTTAAETLNKTKELLEFLSTVRCNYMDDKAATKLASASSKEAVRDVVQEITEAAELRSIKALTKPLITLDEKAYLETRISQMSSEFFVKIDDTELTENVQYLKDNITRLNDTFARLMKLLESTKNADFTQDLSAFSLDDLKLLKEGLDKTRLTQLTKVLRTEFESCQNKTSAFAKYCEALIGFYSGNSSLEEFEASYNAHANYAKQFSQLLEQLTNLKNADYANLELGKLFNTLQENKDKLSEHEKTIIITNVSKDYSTVNTDINNHIKQYIEVNISKDKLESSSIYIRFRSFAAIMKQLHLIPEEKAKKAKEAKEAKEAKKAKEAKEAKAFAKQVADFSEQVADEETGVVVSEMKTAMGSTLETTIKKCPYDNYVGLRQLILQVGTDEALYASYSRELRSLIELQHRAYDTPSEASTFMSSESIHHINELLSMYKGDKDLKSNLISKIDRMFSNFTQDEQYIRVLIQHGSSVIEAFGTDKQKLKLKHLKQLVQYIDIANGSSGAYDISGLHQSLQCASFSSEEPTKLSKLFSIQAESIISNPDLLSKAKALAEVFAFKATITSGNLFSFVIPGLLIMIFNKDNLQLQLKSKAEESKLIEDIACLFINNQINPKCDNARSGFKAVDIRKAFDTFVNEYIKLLKTDSSSTSHESFEGKSCFAEQLIRRLGTTDHIAKIDSIKTADELVAYFKNSLSRVETANLTHASFSRNYMAQINKFCRDKINILPEKYLANFKEYFSDAMKRNKLPEAKSDRWDKKPLTKDDLISEVIDNFKSEMSLKLGAKSRKRCEESDTSLGGPAFSYKVPSV